MKEGNSMIKLTKKENEIMEIIWNMEKPLTAAEIQTKTDMSIYSVQQVLLRLLTKKFVSVVGIKQNKKAFARQYEAIISEADYISAFINNPKTEIELASNLINKSTDLQTIEQLEKLLETRKKELKGTCNS